RISSTDAVLIQQLLHVAVEPFTSGTKTGSEAYDLLQDLEAGRLTSIVRSRRLGRCTIISAAQRDLILPEILRIRLLDYSTIPRIENSIPGKAVGSRPTR